MGMKLVVQKITHSPWFFPLALLGIALTYPLSSARNCPVWQRQIFKEKSLLPWHLPLDGITALGLQEFCPSSNT
jgi:hypothetical protein